MNSAKKQSAENNLHLRVMTAKAKIIAHAEEIARVFLENFGGTLEEYVKYFMTEAEEKTEAKTKKEDIADYVPLWMTPSRWTTGERRTAAKLNAYGINRVLRVDGYSKDRNADEEHRHSNSDKPAIYVTDSGFHKDPRPTWTKKGAWTE